MNLGDIRSKEWFIYQGRVHYCLTRNLTTLQCIYHAEDQNLYQCEYYAEDFAGTVLLVHVTITVRMLAEVVNASEW